MRKLWSLIQIVVFAQALLAAEPSTRSFGAPLPARAPDHDVRMNAVSLRPGAELPAHPQDVHLSIYVIEGTIELQVAGGLQHLSAGEVFTETPDAAHAVLRNPSATVTAKFVSFAI